MSAFFKKIGGALAKVGSVVTGIAAKVLPIPGANIVLSAVSKGLSVITDKPQASASASVGSAAALKPQEAAFSTSATVGGVAIPFKVSTTSKNLVWYVVGGVVLFLGSLFLIFKKK